MPARKSASPEAAQKKVWRAEIKQQEAAALKLNRDFDGEQKALRKGIEAAEKSLGKANAKYTRFIARRSKVLPKTLREIETRIAVLRGRIEA
jgi:hypothetical protein